jgi:hypothetical protein
MSWKKLTCVVLVVGAAFLVDLWLCFPAERQGLQGYSRVVGGMTVEEVRQVMGRGEDQPDGRITTTGEFQRSWTFENGARYNVVFDKDGPSIYKEIAPAGCGVTPLIGKYVNE